MVEEKKRIQFIDLAKGVCITLVVLHHCHIETPYLIYIRMPLYFILSGLFFKAYGGFADFTKRKINKILIPFLFFYTASFAIYLLLSHFAPGLSFNSEVEKFFYLDPWYSRLCFNNPLWFLLSLFWCNLLYYLIQMISKKWYAQGCFAIAFAAVYWLTKDKVFFPLHFDNTLLYFPYFFLGSLLRKTSLLYESTGESFFDKYKDLIIGGICAIMFFCLANIKISALTLPLKMRYDISALGVIALLLLLKRIKRLPLLSYYGRYSIVILCTSFLVYSPLRVIIPKVLHLPGCGNDFVAFVVTMACEYFIIWFCINYMPHVTAQKDVIPVGINKN